MSVAEEKPVAESGGSVGRRRRRWSEAQKRQIVAETHEPGVSVPMVAQRYNLNANQVFGWRRLFREPEGAAETGRLVPVERTRRSLFGEVARGVAPLGPGQGIGSDTARLVEQDVAVIGAAHIIDRPVVLRHMNWLRPALRRWTAMRSPPRSRNTSTMRSLTRTSTWRPMWRSGAE